MSTTTDQDTRLFRFGAIVPEEHQELALRLAELENRLNAAFASEEEPVYPIYFVPTVVTDLGEESSTIEEEKDHLFIRIKVSPSYPHIVTRFVDILTNTGNVEEELLADLRYFLDLAE